MRFNEFNLNEGYTVTRGIDTERYQPRPGLEGPFSAKNGKVVYYDKQEGKYYDPDTDMYIDYNDWQAMNEQGVAEGLGKDLKRLATGKDVKSRAGQEIAKAQQAGMTGDNKTAHKHFKRYDKLDTLANKGVAEGSVNDYFKRRKDEEDRIAGTKAPAKRTPKQTDYEKKRKEQGLAEGMMSNPGEQDSPVAQAIIRRILQQRTDLLSKYGPVLVNQAVDEVADFVGDVDEIGSSDVSGWVRHVEQMLGNMQEGVAEAQWKNMDSYERDYAHSVAGMSGRRNREDDEHHEIDQRREQQLAQYTQSGKFWLKFKDSGRHVSDQSYTGKAAANSAALALLKQQPELKGNLLITAYGPGGE